MLSNPHAGKSECGNDVDLDVYNFFRVLATPVCRAPLLEMVNLLPVHEGLFRDTIEDDDNRYDGYNIRRAAMFFVRIRQSFSGQGKTFAAPSRNRTRGGRNEQVNTWMNAIDGLAEVADRLRNVYWSARPLLDIINGEGTHAANFLYLDPPYHPDTRITPEVYAHEMTREDHERMIWALVKFNVKAKIMLSGYRCPLYDEWLTVERGWHRHDYTTNNQVSSKRTPVIESVWCNYAN